MARQKGSANISASLEVLASAPLDARSRVQTKADLTAANTFPYSYIGMEVYVLDDNAKYRLIDEDPTDPESWQELGSGGSGSDNYDDLSHKPKVNDVVLSGNKTSSELGLQDEFQFEEMPLPAAGLVGKVVQYIGETDANFTHGHFYECKSNGASIGWFEADVMDAPENTFYGTWDEWSNLSQTERDKYEFLDIHGDDETVNFGKYIEVVKILPMPTEAYDGVCKLYDGENESDLVKGTIYECVEVLPSTTPKTYNWTAISTAEVPTATISEPGIVKPDNVTTKVDSEGTISLKQKTFYGTMAEWEALTPEEQNTYEFMDIHGDDESLNLGRFIEKISTMPDANDAKSQVVYYIGATTEEFTNGYFYKSTPSIVSGSVVYNWVQVNTQPTIAAYEDLTGLPKINDKEVKGSKVSSDLGLQDTMQWITLPAPTAALAGKVYQYIGATNTNFTHNYFYECKYNAATLSYVWGVVDVSQNESMHNRVTALENNQGDMTQLTISGVSDIVSALNRLALDKVRNIVYNKPNLVVTYEDDTTYTFNVSTILSETNIGELANILDTNIQDTNLLQYDASISKYKPYDISGALSALLTSSKDYTDAELAKFAQADALVVDAKPTYSSSTGVVVYYQDGTMHTTNKAETRFYYTTSGESYCTSWIDGIEFTFSVASVDWSEYVNKTNDVVSTYSTDMPDKTKIPDIASLDALYAIIVAALGLKVNTADIVDDLTSENATVPLSAKQGKVLATAIAKKQDIIQYDTMPSPVSSLEGKVIQYIGEDSQSFSSGRFYKCVEVTPATDPATYQWVEQKFSSDYDQTIIENSVNAPQGGAVFTGLASKQDKTLSAPLVVDDVSATTVEDSLSALNTKKNRKFQFTTMPNAIEDLEGVVVQFIGATSGGFKEGSFYKCVEITPSTSPKTYQWTEITANITLDNHLDISSNNGIENAAVTGAIQALQEGVFIFYENEASLPPTLDYTNGIIVTVGTIGYCVQEKTFHKVSAINSTSKAITWVTYDPHILVGSVSAGNVTYDPTTSGLEATNTQDAIDEIKAGLGTAAAKNATTYVGPGNHALVEAGSVYSAITQAVRGAYHPSGNKTCAQLTSELLVQANVGNTYKITDDGVTTNLFYEGAGLAIHAGDGATVIFDDTAHAFKFSLQTGLIDLTPYQLKEDCENFKNIWVGHKADWEALTTAEKTEYDEAHFDDDDPFDIGTVVDITSQIGKGEGWTSGGVYVEKCGHLVTLNFHSTVTSGYDKVVYNNLPKPISNGHYFVLQGDRGTGTTQLVGIATLNLNGTITSGTSNAGLDPGKVWDGTVCYFTND